MARSKWNQIRRVSSKVTILAGDAQAISRGRFTQRITNRIIGRLLNKATRKVWR